MPVIFVLYPFFSFPSPEPLPGYFILSGFFLFIIFNLAGKCNVFHLVG